MVWKVNIYMVDFQLYILQVKDAWKDPSEPAEKTQGSFIGTLNIDDP